MILVLHHVKFELKKKKKSRAPANPSRRAAFFFFFFKENPHLLSCLFFYKVVYDDIKVRYSLFSVCQFGTL